MKLLNSPEYKKKPYHESKNPSNQANIHFRTRDISSKYKKVQKSLQVPAHATVSYRYDGYKKEKHPLIPQKYFKSKDRKTVDHDSVDTSVKKDRILHSSFYMHKLNKKTNQSC